MVETVPSSPLLMDAWSLQSARAERLALSVNSVIVCRTNSIPYNEFVRLGIVRESYQHRCPPNLHLHIEHLQSSQ